MRKVSSGLKSHKRCTSSGFHHVIINVSVFVFRLTRLGKPWVSNGSKRKRAKADLQCTQQWYSSQSFFVYEPLNFLEFIIFVVSFVFVIVCISGVSICTLAVDPN